MPGFVQEHTREWLDYFARRGYPDAVPLAAGLEGAVYLLGNGTVAKVWGHKRRPELAAMQRFYADVARADLPFATPVILRVEVAGGLAVTFERELPGEPLQKRLAPEDRSLDEAAVECVTAVLRAQARRGAGLPGRGTPPLPGGVRDSHEQRLHLRRQRRSLLVVRSAADGTSRHRGPRPLAAQLSQRLASAGR